MEEEAQSALYQHSQSFLSVRLLSYQRSYEVGDVHIVVGAAKVFLQPYHCMDKVQDRLLSRAAPLTPPPLLSSSNHMQEPTAGETALAPCFLNCGMCLMSYYLGEWRAIAT